MKINLKKVTFIVLGIILYCQLNAQDSIRNRIPVDSNTKLVTYKNAVNIPGTKDEPYKRAIEWVNANYKNAADVTHVRDAVNGLIEGQHRIQLSFKNSDSIIVKTGLVEYSFTLQFKDNKYRYIFTNFYLKDKSRYPIENWMDKTKQGYSPLWDEYLKIIDNDICRLIDSLKIIMIGKKVIKDDW
jgi:hypothetical protein